MNFITFYQIPVDSAANIFLDYGLIGAVAIFLIIVVHKFYSKIDDNAQEWKNEAKDMRAKYYDLFMMMRDSSEKLIDIRERDVKERREHEQNLDKKMDELPERIVKEIHFARLQDSQKVKKTPTG
jgi:hypothetical protein